MKFSVKYVSGIYIRAILFIHNFFVCVCVVCVCVFCVCVCVFNNIELVSFKINYFFIK
jgi:hypothetical protein